MNPETRLELQRLLSALCDDELTGAQHARLGELLAADAACRREYLDYLDLHAHLLLRPALGGSGTLPAAGSAPSPSAADPDSPPPAAAPARRRRLPQAVRYG